MALRKFQGDQPGFLRAYVCDGMRVAAFDPGSFSGFEFDLRRAFAFDVAAQMQVGDGYHDVRSVVMMFGKDASGVEQEVSGADIVLDEEDVLGAAVEDVEAAFLVPFMEGLEFVALQEFDGDDLEGLVSQIFRGVGEGTWNEDGLAVLEGTQERILADDVVFDLRRREDHEDVVVAVVVHDHGGVRREVNLESARIRILEQQVMAGFGSDLDDRGCGLCGGEDCNCQQEREKPEWFHRAEF
jgi:hypothetical protein